jgi:hypothetical protein
MYPHMVLYLSETVFRFDFVLYLLRVINSAAPSLMLPFPKQVALLLGLPSAVGSLSSARAAAEVAFS